MITRKSSSSFKSVHEVSHTSELLKDKINYLALAKVEIES
jgi:hypothetical protein